MFLFFILNIYVSFKLFHKNQKVSFCAYSIQCNSWNLRKHSDKINSQRKNDTQVSNIRKEHSHGHQKSIRNIEELQKIQALANYATEDVGIHSEDSSIIVDAKSFMGLFALDFTRPVLIVSEDLNFHRRIANVGETLEFNPHIYQQMVCK